MDTAVFPPSWVGVTIGSNRYDPGDIRGSNRVLTAGDTLSGRNGEGAGKPIGEIEKTS
jgi:hypothetical protein